MARLENSPADRRGEPMSDVKDRDFRLEMAKLELSRDRFREVGRTIRVCVISLAIVGSIVAICWACVHIFEKPAWLEAVSIVFGSGGLVAMVFKYFANRATKRAREMQAEIAQEESEDQP